MKIKIEFSTDNAAFDDDAGPEIHRILQHVCLDIREGLICSPIRDINGNTIGIWSWE